MQWLLLCLCLSAATALEFLCKAPHCTAHVNQFSTNMTFEIEGGKLEILDSLGSFFINCYGWNVLESPAMPRFLTKINRDKIYLSDCPLPTGNASISDTFKALNITMTSVNGETNLYMHKIKSIHQLKPHHFYGFEFLTKLTIMTNEFDTKISAGIFSKLSNLRSLTLANVQINVGELSQLPQSLTSLNLRGDSANILSRTFPEAIVEASQAMPKLKILTLEVDHCDNSESTAENKIKVEENRKMEVFLEAVTIERWSEKQLMPLQRSNRLRTLDMIKCRVEKLPDRFVADCPRLNRLSIVSSRNLTELPAKFLEGAKSLKRLEIKHCKIESVPDGFFQGAPNLRELELSNNKLKHLSNELFMRLPLQVLILENNTLTKDILSSVASMTALTELSLRGNIIHYSCNKAGYSELRNLTKMKILNLSNNKITNICHDWRENLIHLKYLNLAKTLIKELKYADLQYKRDPCIDKAEVTLNHGVRIRITKDDYKNALNAPMSGATVHFQGETSSDPYNSENYQPNIVPDCDCSVHWLKEAIDDNAVKVKGYFCRHTWKINHANMGDFCGI